MNRLRFSPRIFLLIIASLLLAAISDGQTSAPPTKARIQELINESSSKDSKIAAEAREALDKLDSRSLEPVIELTRSGEPCERVGAALLLFDLDPKNNAAIPELVNVASSRGGFSSEAELVCRRNATVMLAHYVEGIPILTRLLTDKDVFLRQGAVFGFDELTETDEYPAGSKQLIMDAIPVLAQATKDHDEIVREMAAEVLDQIVNGPDKDLSAAAKKLAPHIQK